MECSIDKGFLTVKIPIEKTLRPSKPPKGKDGKPTHTTGKNLLLANSGGFQATTLDVKGEVVKINLCAIIPNPEFDESVIT